MSVKIHDKTKQISIERGVRQGDTLSTKLFITVLEYAFKILNFDNKEITLDGEKLNHRRFADDIILITDDLGEVKEMVNELELEAICCKIRLKMNFIKTEFMTNLNPSG